MFRPKFAAAIAAAALAATLAACGGGAGGSDDDGPVTITFWHAMSGNNGETLAALVQEFNDTNDSDITVEAVFQGKYNELLTKLKASIQSNGSPTLAQVFEIGTQIMVDTGATVPFEELAAEQGVSMDGIDPSIASYFTVDGQLQALPFNTSGPLVYLNVDALTEAGLDPDTAPTTWSEVLELADQLTERNGSETSRYGMVLSIDGWFVEQMLAAGGVDYCDASNGREGRADAVNWEGGEVADIVSGWADGVQDGTILNVGRNNTDAAAAFQAGRAAMIMFTSANLRDMISESDFEVAVKPYVRPDGTDAGGAFNGGAALWTMASATDAERAAAAEFQEFLVSADAQSSWATSTGYIPLNPAAVETDEFSEVLEEFPAFSVAGEQLQASTGTGCLMGTMPQARDAMNDIIESAITGSAEVSTAIENAQSSMETIIADYNASVG
ncbi:ABC transporter substrate-binding protein [Pseudactinotalea sp.]|uniref:ABC transporter substrate-binding protein n=1 Tax=Pseudactinotalea sp. TaxID=1926260 RepID=UPI003B3A418F